MYVQILYIFCHVRIEHLTAETDVSSPYVQFRIQTIIMNLIEIMLTHKTQAAIVQNYCVEHLRSLRIYLYNRLRIFDIAE